jgi:hypothetical protein
MNAKQPKKWELAGVTKYLEKTYPRTTKSTTNSTWPDLGLNLGSDSWKAQTNHLSYGIVTIIINIIIISSSNSIITSTTPLTQEPTVQIITITYHEQLELLDHSLSCPPCSGQCTGISPHPLAAHQLSWGCHHPLHALCNDTKLLISRAVWKQSKRIIISL